MPQRSNPSIANPRGSVGARLLARRIESPVAPLTPAPKKTSGLVQAATARRMWVVMKESPTW